MEYAAHRPRPPFFRRSARWIAGIALVLTISVIAIGITGYCVVTREVVRISVDEAERDAEEAVPVGASRDQVVAYLEGRGYEHWYVESSGSSSFLEDNGVSPGSSFVGGLIPDTYESFLVTGDIFLYFMLDDDQRVERILVEGSYTGP